MTPEQKAKLERIITRKYQARREMVTEDYWTGRISTERADEMYRTLAYAEAEEKRQL